MVIKNGLTPEDDNKTAKGGESDIRTSGTEDSAAA